MLSCIGYKDKDYFNALVEDNNIQYLKYNNLDYFYHYTSGFEDTIGINYYHFSFDEYASDFINQFSSGDNRFYIEKSTDFEEKLMENIKKHINNKYSQIKDKYKIDFEKSYIYSNFPMIYYKETNELIIIEFIWVP